MNNLRVTDELVDELMEESDACQRSVLRVLLGLPVNGPAGRRLKRVLIDRGIAQEQAMEEE